MPTGGPIHILAVTGSLRAASSNTALLRAAALVAPADVAVTVFTGLDTLPHFNPDLDREGATAPPAVTAFRARVLSADALLISSPEYAHGIPGSLKNALDWLVSVPELPGRPVALLDASPRAMHARASLAEVLRTMSLDVLPGASRSLQLNDRTAAAEALAADPQTAEALRAILTALASHVRTTATRAARPPAGGEPA